ncbi:5-formyltetrahydrofolate cyclo-ligase [Bacillaceae bacterium IKA-2]|jgi:5-formyltetrahydrofolate cyclo-ligase|nr:5-formyltetrahydrofolate cyclo-ligase [Bacillaceae bacterium IKA-2]
MKNKGQLRNEMKQRLLKMKETDYILFCSEIKNKLLQSKEWDEATTIGITIATKREIDTIPIIEAGWKQGKQIVVPKCFPKEKKLNFYQINSFLEVEDSFYSLKEPITTLTPFVNKEQIDLVIVPGLIFDKEGYRIGFGGGYYDRYLNGYHNDTIALAFDFQLVDEVPKEAYDIPVRKIITNTSKEDVQEVR